MPELTPFEPNRPLFERWRSSTIAPVVPEPDMLTLAAYLDSRLDETAAESVEAALATNPDLLDALLELKQPLELESPSRNLIEQAQALVPVAQAPVVVSFRRQNRAIGAWAAWAAVAASLVVVSLVGFDVGVRTEQAISGPAGSETSNDLFFQSSGSDDGIG
jgi:hypothetical protein